MAGTGIWGDPKKRPYTAAVAMLAVVALLILLGFASDWGPFATDPFTLNSKANPSPSVWQLILSDRFTLGFTRVTLAAIGLFLLASLAALAVTGRWINSLFGARTDPAKVAKRNKAMVEALAEIQRLKSDVQERDRSIVSLERRVDQYEQARKQALEALLSVRKSIASLQRQRGKPEIGGDSGETST